MIIEWITSQLTPASRVARALGYVNSSVALAHRFKRCKTAWTGHIEACHQVILNHRPEHGKKILIIGSGLLLEVPFDQLMEDPKAEVTLIDMVHPLSVRKKVKKYANRVKLLELDVTGSAHLFNDKKSFAQVAALDFKPPVLEQLKNYDYVVSANIISQLSLDPFERLRKSKSELATDEFFVTLSKRMGEQHVAWLKTLGSKILLIGDVNRTYFDRTGQETDQVQSACVTREGKLIKSWDWLISPLGETSKDYSYSMFVEARIL